MNDAVVTEERKPPFYRWINLIIYMYVAALTQLYWLNFAAIDTYMEKALHISAMNLSLLTVIFPFIYLFLSLPSGILIDKKGFKFGVGVGVIFVGVFPLLRLIAPNSFAMLLASQFGIALGQPFILNGVAKLSVTWFPENEEATAVGLGSLALFLGMIMALGATPAIVKNFGYTTMLWFYTILGLIGLFIYFLFVKSQPSVAMREVVTSDSSLYFEGMKKLFKIRDFILLGFIAMIGIGVFNGLATWLEKILNELHGISMVDAGEVSSMLIFGGILGSIVIPVISDTIKRRKPFLIFAPLLGMLDLICLLECGSLSMNMLNAFITGFFVISAFPIILIFSAEVCGQEYAGISTAYLQLLGNGAAVAIVPIMELLHKSTGKYIAPISLLIALSILSFIFAVFLEEEEREGRA